jgi:DNA replication protein DnaC
VQHGEHHGRFLEAVELFLKLRDTFSKDSPLDESGILAGYVNVPLLLLDDLGAEKVSDYVKQTLYLLINKRYGDCRDTFITSNLSLEEIGHSYGDRLASRIAGKGEELILKGKDRRLK